MKMRILLVEPAFPYPSKSKNKANQIHKNFVPIGLLKLGAFFKAKGDEVKLVRGKKEHQELGDFLPNEICVTSVFTYWSKYVWDTIHHYRSLFPRVRIKLGGIYATLHSEKRYFREYREKYKVKCHVGLHAEADRVYPDYSILEKGISHHVTHAMRGCIRRCSFCGTWKLEPRRCDKTPEELVEEIETIGKNKVIFFDNNFLANANIKPILNDLKSLRVNNKSVTYESQSGFDGRLLLRDPELAFLLKEARFQNVRIAWDNEVRERKSIERQVQCLISAGFKAKDIAIFVLYNYDIPYGEMLKKLDLCAGWGTQVADCRYRPLDSREDNYNPHKVGQTIEEYYIHEKAGWTDEKVKDYRRRVREHNIWIRYAKDKGLKYDKNMEKWSAIHNTFKFFNMGRPPQLEVLEESPTWKRRIARMNTIKTYCKRNGPVVLDFSALTRRQIDEQLERLISSISKNGKKSRL
jgi:hypothetical protein